MQNPDLSIYSEPMLVRPGSASVVAKLMYRVMARQYKGDVMPPDPDDDPEEESEDEGYEEGEIDPINGEKTGRIAVIRACGVLMRGVAGLECWGLCDYETLTEQIEDADSDDNIDGIALIVDSPGGEVIGCAEAAAALESCSKPSLVFSSGLDCSAAFWLSCGASMIVGTRSSRWGSIGVYVPILDQSGWFAQMGLSVDLIKSGDQKGAGYPGTSLTDSQRTRIQASVDRTASAFQTAVTDSRPSVDLSLFDGRDVDGLEAVELGLIDSVARDFDEAVEMFRAIL